jgi:hypothetical protein
MTQDVERTLTIFSKHDERFVGEWPLTGIDLAQLQTLFGAPSDDPMYDVYPVGLDQAPVLSRVVGKEIDLEQYDYFVECHARDDHGPDRDFRLAWDKFGQARTCLDEGDDRGAIANTISAALCLLQVFKALKDPTFDVRHDLIRLFHASGFLDCGPSRIPTKGFSVATAEDYFRRLQAAATDLCRALARNRRLMDQPEHGAGFGAGEDHLREEALSLLESAQIVFDMGAFRWISLKKLIPS